MAGHRIGGLNWSKLQINRNGVFINMNDCLGGDTGMRKILVICNTPGGKVSVAANRRKEMVNGEKQDSTGD